MPDKIYSSIEEFDKEYEAKSKQTAPAEAPKEEVVEEEATEAAPEAVEATTEPTEQPAEAAVEETPKKEPAKDVDKAAYKFEQMRKEQAALKKQLDDQQAMIRQFEELSRLSGFENAAKMLEKWQQQQVTREAQAQNIDPKFYQEHQEIKKKLATIEQEKIKLEQQSKLATIGSELEKASTSIGLSKTEFDNLLNQMGEDGFTIDSLVNLPTKSVVNIFNGYASSIITERKVQERLSKMQKGEFKEEKHTAPAATPKAPNPFSLDELKKEMEQYAKENMPWLMKK